MSHRSRHAKHAQQREGNEPPTELSSKLYEEHRVAPAKPDEEEYSGPTVFGIPLPLFFLVSIILLGVAGLVGKVFGLF